MINALGIIAARFVTYFEERGRHEIVSFLQSVAGVMTLFLLAPENQGVVARITGGELSKEVFVAFIAGMIITFIKSSSYAAIGNKDLIRNCPKKK
jgi:hypothetical protein